MTTRRLASALAFAVALAGPYGGATAVAAAPPPPELLSVTPAGTAGNGLSGTFGLSMAAGGGAVAYSSAATDLGPPVPGPTPQIYVRSLSRSSTTLASAKDGTPGDALSTRPSISGDGSRVAFLSAATNLDPRDPDQRTDAYVAAADGSAIELVSTSSSGEKADAVTTAVTLSADGGTVAFVSAAGNLGLPGGVASVYVKDLGTGAVEPVPTPATDDPGELGASGVSLSADGRRVAFSTDAALLPEDRNARSDVYVWDRGTGELTLASRTPAGSAGNQGSTDAVLTADGSSVVFASFASDLHPADDEPGSDIYRSRLTGAAVELLSTAAGGAKANASSSLPSVSGDGRWVSFASYATNLDPRAAAGWQLDVYVKDTTTGDVRLASASADGTRADGTSLYSALSAAGSRVAFTTNSTTLSPMDGNRLADVYLFDPFPAAEPPPEEPPEEEPPPSGGHGHCHHGDGSHADRAHHCRHRHWCHHRRGHDHVGGGHRHGGHRYDHRHGHRRDCRPTVRRGRR
jgi:Tol biopolymer transport system component